jgi:murein DD-endopeptidase MepM/ murein hydrolase activator NlpD
MAELPTLGAPPKKSALPGIAVFAIVVGSVAGGVYWFSQRSVPAEKVATAAIAQPVVEPATAAPPTAVVPAELNAVVTGTAPVAAAAPSMKDGYKTFSATINGPVEKAIIGATNKEVGGALTQVVTRSLVWWVNVPGDLLKGDVLSGLYEEREGQEPLVHAVRLTSRKFGKTFEAYRYKATGSEFARFYNADGSELEEHLNDCPLESWEQITSLLRDGRHHKGVDFKTPVGSNVHATFDGTITSKNWNFRGNGNSLKVQESGGSGRTALFLHLSELPKSVQVGDKVKKGQILAKSGNTGHSFAPHLHYQLMQGEKVIDPFKSQAVSHVSLPTDEKPKFDAAAAKLRVQLPTEPIAGG